jgi:hypothetical protein
VLLWGVVMSARKSLTFSRPSPPTPPNHQGRIPASGSRGRESEADLGLPIFDGRLPICGFPHPLARPTKVLFKVRNDPWNGSVKSLMKENATMERQGRAGGFAPRPPGFIAWVPGWKGVGERVSLAPNPSRPRSRRSGRIPAEPYSPPRPR